MTVKSWEKIWYVSDPRHVHQVFKETALILKWNLMKSVIDVNQRTKEKEKHWTVLEAD